MAQYGLAYLIKNVIKMSDIRQRRLRHLYIKLANMIDYVSTLLIDMLDQRSYMILFDLLIKTDKMFQVHLNHLRSLDPNWNIMREFRSSRLLIKLLVDTLIKRISDVDTSNLETLNLESCYRVHQVLRVIRGLDPSWSINGSVRFGVLN